MSRHPSTARSASRSWGMIVSFDIATSLPSRQVRQLALPGVVFLKRYDLGREGAKRKERGVILVLGAPATPRIHGPTATPRIRVQYPRASPHASCSTHSCR